MKLLEVIETKEYLSLVAQVKKMFPEWISCIERYQWNVRGSNPDMKPCLLTPDELVPMCPYSIAKEDCREHEAFDKHFSTVKPDAISL